MKKLKILTIVPWNSSAALTLTMSLVLAVFPLALVTTLWFVSTTVEVSVGVLIVAITCRQTRQSANVVRACLWHLSIAFCKIIKHHYLTNHECIRSSSTLTYPFGAYHVCPGSRTGVVKWWVEAVLATWPGQMHCPARSRRSTGRFPHVASPPVWWVAWGLQTTQQRSYSKKVAGTWV